MNFADIENTWRSPQNDPSPAQIEKDKMKFTTDLNRRRRGFVLFICLVLGVLTLVTAPFAIHFSKLAPGASEIDITREWGSFLLMALPWGAAIFLLVAYRRHRARHGIGAASVPETLLALIDENRLSRNRIKLVATLHAVVLLVLPVVAMQLRATGKAGDEIIVPVFVLWPLIAGAILLGMVWHYRRTLLPRKRELENLLSGYARQERS